MSVFFQNTCQHSTCRRSFFTLTDLIVHIENDHLDFTPHRVEQLEAEKPELIPLSYVLKFSGPEDAPPQYPLNAEVSFNEAVIQEIDDVGANEVVSVINNNYLSDFRDRKVKSEARLNQEVPHIGNNKLFTLDGSHKKPFVCNMKGCEKRYKNVNGIKYHYKKHHKMLIPTLKKTLLKHKSLLNVPKPQFEKQDLHGIPLYSYQASMPEFVYHNVQNMPRLEDCDTNEFLYKLPTSDVTATQVPLSNMSFNYYNVSEIGDIEDFSGKNSAYFVPNF